MASFLSGSNSLTRFRINEDGIPQAFWDSLRGKLLQFVFRSIDDVPEKQAFGWTNFDDMLDTTWQNSPPEKAEYIALGFRIDSRRIPGAVLKKTFRLALEEEKRRMSEQGKNFISRERKREIKEQVTLRLRARVLPVPEFYQAVWDVKAGTILLNTAAVGKIDLFCQLFTNTFGLHLEQVTPHSLAVEAFPDKEEALAGIEPAVFADGHPSDVSKDMDSLLGADFLTWLWYRSDTAPGAFADRQGAPFAVSMEQRIVVEGGKGGARETTSVSGPLASMREAYTGLADGKKVTRALLRIEAEGTWQVTLKAEDANLYSLRTPRLDKSDGDEDPDALLLEKIYLIEKCITFVDDIYEQFLLLRLSDAWPNEVKLVSDWIERTKNA